MWLQVNIERCSSTGGRPGQQAPAAGRCSTSQRALQQAPLEGALGSGQPPARGRPGQQAAPRQRALQQVTA